MPGTEYPAPWKLSTRYSPDEKQVLIRRKTGPITSKHSLSTCIEIPVSTTCSRLFHGIEGRPESRQRNRLQFESRCTDAR